MQIAMIEDKIIGFDKLESVYLDRGFYFGDGVYEVVRSYDGKIFALDEHLERFSRSLLAIGIERFDIGVIRERVLKGFSESEISNAKIYFHMTRGSAVREHVSGAELQPNFFLTVTELDVEKEKEKKAEGIAVSSHPDWRWKRCDIKSLNLLANVLARADAAKKGCEEAILVDDNGFITEGAGSAFFGVTGEKLLTAPLSANILPSITRKYVIESGRKIGMEIVEESLTVEQVKEADELFIAVTTKDIVGVVKFDDKIIGGGKVGRYSSLLADKFREFTR